MGWIDAACTTLFRSVPDSAVARRETEARGIDGARRGRAGAAAHRCLLHDRAVEPEADGDGTVPAADGSSDARRAGRDLVRNIYRGVETATLALPRTNRRKSGDDREFRRRACPRHRLNNAATKRARSTSAGS